MGEKNITIGQSFEQMHIKRNNGGYEVESSRFV